MGFNRPPIEARVANPLVLTSEQLAALDVGGLLFLFSTTFQFIKTMSLLRMGAKCRDLHRIMVAIYSVEVAFC
ncbi:hypothetical protein FRX31_002397 [Thalictrum thalictroides]|uniref:Uncharacterized protein n=1 Tax=Thalictrum thalictroides TaxID=46969 RepID=A0A7J6XDY3_THATH|nr:hypothetical protein FRX31_002397 [Thalictrum thalictroides]